MVREQSERLSPMVGKGIFTMLAKRTVMGAAMALACSCSMFSIRSTSSVKGQDDVAPVIDRFRPRANAPRSELDQSVDEASFDPVRTSESTPQSKNPRSKQDELPRVAARNTTATSVDYSDDLAGLTPEERTNIAVYERNNKSVVNVMTRMVRPDFFSIVEVAEGSGSGAVLDQKGHILTNLHVIEGAREIRVTIHNGETFEAGLVGQDPLNDIAVLRIAAPPEDLNPISIGNSDRLRVGQKIYAIGNPFGLERTLTTGIVSSLNRTLPARNERQMRSIIQIDAALNQGNSGGPLLDSRGEMIGMNAAIASRTGENTGVGFAIPASTIRRVVPQLVETGRVIRPESGIEAIQTDRGLVIAKLTPGGPGERAGLRGFRVIREQRQRGPYLYERTRIDQSTADTIVAVNGIPVETRDDFLTQLEKHKPSDTVTLAISRRGRKQDVPLTLEAN